MAFTTFFLLSLLAFATTLPLVTFAEAVSSILDFSSLNRTSFPPGFIFGSASSAYQYEGAAKEDGRGTSTWDTFTNSYPERIMDRSNADASINGYHMYKEDVGIMKNMNFDAYRFSISWSRILPSNVDKSLYFTQLYIYVHIYHCISSFSSSKKYTMSTEGRLSGGINQEGIKYYNNLINELLSNGVQPFATLFHWDFPQALEDEYGGFLSPQIVDDFRDFAELCFEEFGDRVKQWITLNEPSNYNLGSYAVGTFPPNRCSNWQNLNCTGGNSGIEPYIVAHHMLLAHAAAVQVYKTKYQVPLLLKRNQNISQEGKIGIALVTQWFVPTSDTKLDQNAAQRSLDFVLGWFMEPLTKGEYPKSMQSLVGSRLPKFSKEQARLLNGSFDFLGLNYYTAMYVSNAPNHSNVEPSYLTDSLANTTRAASFWLYVYPKGLQNLLLYIKKKYNNPIIYITENGVDEDNDPTLSLDQALMDVDRIKYHYQHLCHVLEAIRNGVNVKGYFAWSMFDNFEWNEGYTVRFGIYFVDYKNKFRRYSKLSAQWFQRFMKRF
ncbi:putative beta-glucosidase [Lupinus albus]|uniref:Putative beta-glucosidase n=1 Tax=Lupinus albus TaxID=3870 RepID=A0A6A4PFW2_LUPAL|nr:putative beta-glucosidase [Lupinus albus]